MAILTSDRRRLFLRDVKGGYVLLVQRAPTQVALDDAARASMPRAQGGCAPC